jgi:hypothetical protein
MAGAKTLRRVVKDREAFARWSGEERSGERMLLHLLPVSHATRKILSRVQ